MKVRICTKFDVTILEYQLGQNGEEAYKRIPDLGDHVEIDNERYSITDRTFIPQQDMVVLQAWKPLIKDKNDY